LTFRSRAKDRAGLHELHDLEKPFAFAYLPLIRDSACIKDGNHDLVLYRMEKNLQPAPHMYFEAPAEDRGQTLLSVGSTKSMTPLRDRMSVRTFLCSNIHTQDDTLRSLFRWQGNINELASIEELLQRFAFVDEDELSKFVPRVLDSLFGIMVSNLGEKQDELDEQVFKALMKVLAMSSDRRYPAFVPVLESYIATTFNYPASSYHLLRSTRSVMSRPQSQEYRSFLKVWHLFFRFIVRSRELDRARGIGLDATSKHIEADFQRQTKSILTELNSLMLSSDKSLIGTQTLAVQHYADILPDLAQVFPPLEIAELVIAFADTLTFAKGSIAVYKLLLLLQVVKSVFNTTEARALLVPALVRWVKPHLGKYEAGFAVQGETGEVRDGKKVKWLECNRLAVTVGERWSGSRRVLTIQVVAWTVNKLQEWYSSPLILEDRSLRLQEEDNLEYCLTLLPRWATRRLRERRHH
jgi:dedicator of cytokinesis protein 3